MSSAKPGEGSPSKGSGSLDKEGKPLDEKEAADRSASEKSGTEPSSSGSQWKSEDKGSRKSHSKNKDHSGDIDKSEEKSQDKYGSKTEHSGDKSGEKSGDKSVERTGDKSVEKTVEKSGSKNSKSGSKSGSKSASKSASKSPEKSGERRSTEKNGEKSDRSVERSVEFVKKVAEKVEGALREETQEQEVDGGGTPKEVFGGSQREGSQQQQGDVGRMGDDKGIEGINALPELHALRLIYENALLNVRNRQLQWLMSEVKQEHLVTMLYVGQLRKRRGTYARPTAIMVDHAVSATLIGADGVAQPATETISARYDDSRYANLPCVTVNIEDKGISAQDESLYALGRGGPGFAKKCKHMTGPQDDLNWEELQNNLLPAFYTF